MSAPVVHIVGRALQFGPFMRQLCAWCGERLVDLDASRIATPEGQSFNPFWTEGELLDVDKTEDGFCTRRSIIAHEDGAPVPANCCAAPPRPPPALRVV